MCTALTLHTKDHYFGRNLDLSCSYQESVTITPQNYPFSFRLARPLNHHYAIIGMAFVSEQYPLYYDAVNEKGVGIAGLYFPENTVYQDTPSEGDNIAPFELIPWICGQCASVSEARTLLQRLRLVRLPFRETLPLSPLHWLISDPKESIVVESRSDGLKVYDNPAGVLTNNPPFDFMQYYLANFRGLSSAPTGNQFGKIDLPAYCQGMGALGLPGDYSSASRFVKACFVKLNSISGDSEEESVSQFFHILGSVEMPRGCVKLEHGDCDLTLYSSCCNLERGIYYYVTYDNRQITAIDLHRENLDGDRLISYPLRKEPSIFRQN